MPVRMERCSHGMEPAWCYLCRIDASGVDPHSAWGLDAIDGVDDPGLHPGPMRLGQSAYLRFLCGEFQEVFDASLTEGQAALVIESFLDESMDESQGRTLGWLSERAGAPADDGLTYGQARTKIRRLVALRGLKSA